MRTLLTLVIDHKKPIANLSKLIEQRAYNLPGIDDVNVYAEGNDTDLITLPVIDQDDLKEFHSRVFKDAGVRS